jgi:GH43 family beta-xylosidase
MIRNSFYKQFFVVLLLIVLCCKEDVGSESQLPLSGKFKNPILDHAPDPWVFQKDDWYYFTHTTGHDLRLYRTKKMSELRHAESKIIWTPPPSGANSKDIWAPEIHFVNNKWYFYYAADNGMNEEHRMWALENSSADPFSGTWVDKGEVQLPDDRWAIDGTIFSHAGSLYFLWSGWEGTTDVAQNIYIARMTDPVTPEGTRVLLSTPELTWEKNGSPPTVNEAPQFLQNGNKLFIVYSASGCWTDDYALGLLSSDSNADILNPSSWTKSQQPVFSKNASSAAYAPGHNSFFKSPDGTENWIIYHANSSTGDGCGNDRSTRMQKFAWKSDLSPDFGIPAAVGAALPVPAGEE